MAVELMLTLCPGIHCILTGSMELLKSIDIMHKLGMCISYEQVMDIPVELVSVMA